MFLVKKEGQKSWKQMKYVEDITEENLESVFFESEVYRLIRVDKQGALEVQKQKMVDALRKQQEEIANQLKKLGALEERVPHSNVSINKEVEQLNEKKEGIDIPEPITVTYNDDGVAEPSKPTFTSLESKNKTPINPSTGEEYTKEQLREVYMEFNDMAEGREEISHVTMGDNAFIVNMSHDIKLSPTHRGIPLIKNML